MSIPPNSGFSTAKWIVSSTAGQGTHTTIATALTAASSGDTIFIRPGTYTENPTLKAGVNLTSFGSESSLNGTGNVIISGTCTMTVAGSVTISGIQLQTNSAALIAVTGSAASIVNLQNCYLNCGTSAITYSSSSASSAINIEYCQGNISTTGVKLFAHTSAGVLGIYYSQIQNIGASVTASTISSGIVSFVYSSIQAPITTTGTSSFTGFQSDFNCASINTTALTLGGSGATSIEFSRVQSGTASAISVGGTLSAYNDFIVSTNTDAITGGGTIQFEYLGFSEIGSSFINTTTQSPVQQTVIQEISTTGTYTPTAAMKYVIIEVLGGGGAGGGAAITSASQNSIGGPGGAGEYARGVFTAAQIGTSQAVTIGAGGTGVSGGTGNTGGTTSVGDLITAIGGTGGATQTGTITTPIIAVSGIGGSGGTGGTVRSSGMLGVFGFMQPVLNYIISGTGANSQYGTGGNAIALGSNTGQAAAGFGAGGGGGAAQASQAAAVLGGAGAKGVAIFTEFCY